VEYPTLLDVPQPRIRAYPREAVVAEKFQAMVVLGSTNSRLKDFYDLFVLSARFSFSGDTLTKAIAATFARRKTPIPTAPPAPLSPAFFSGATRATQWRGYLDRNSLPGAPNDFDATGEVLRAFLGPPFRALAAGEDFSGEWQPGGPWR